jgi:uncharacterized protein (TIGR03067 family)
MNVYGFLILTAGLVLGSQSDLDKLQGSWRTVSLVNGGKRLVGEGVPQQPGPATVLVYEGDRWLVKVGGKTVASGIFKIDAAKMPKEIDVLDESGTKNDKAKLGIYALDGDRYTYCLAPAGKPRPAEFSSPEGSGYSLGVSEREKL